MPENDDNEIVIKISLSSGSWMSNLQDLERRIGASPQSAGYYCTSHTDAKAVQQDAE
jgi:hypothetical protein